MLDHIEDGSGMPDGLITALHYEGTPNRLTAMYDAMMHAMPNGAPTTANATPPTRLSFGVTVLLGAFAGLTIFLGLPIARAPPFDAGRRRAPQRVRDRYPRLLGDRDLDERDHPGERRDRVLAQRRARFRSRSSSRWAAGSC